MKNINTLTDIDYLNVPEGRLLFVALSMLMVEVFKDKNPDETIAILNERADSFLPKGKQ